MKTNSLNKEEYQVSAVVPVYNSVKTLKRAVYSLLLQPEIDEIFLVEDGSTDGSLKVCQELEKEIPFLHLLRHPNGENKGAPASRNLGLQHAKNPWIQFMDADDELLHGKISDQLASLSTGESLVVSPFTKIEENEAVYIPKKDIWTGLLVTRLGVTSANLWNTQWVKAAGAWDESLSNVQEYHLMFEMFKLNDKVAFSHKNLSRIYVRPDSITNSPIGMSSKRDTYFKFRKNVREYLLEKGILTFTRRHYYEVATGENLKYHQPSFAIPFRRSYFLLYKFIKKFRPLYRVKSTSS